MKLNLDYMVSDAVINTVVFVGVAGLIGIAGYELFRNTPLYKKIGKYL